MYDLIWRFPTRIKYPISRYHNTDPINSRSNLFLSAEIWNAVLVYTAYFGADSRLGMNIHRLWIAYIQIFGLYMWKGASVMELEDQCTIVIVQEANIELLGCVKLLIAVYL